MFYNLGQNYSIKTSLHVCQSTAIESWMRAFEFMLMISDAFLWDKHKFYPIQAYLPFL